MSDAGKILLGTSGNPLTSADGKIVVADNMYPVRVSATTGNGYTRTVYYTSSEGPPYAVSDVYSASWEEPSSIFARAKFTYAERAGAWQNVATQGMRRWSTPETVEWARVAKVRTLVQVNMAGIDEDDEGILEVYATINATAPESNETPWLDDGWDLVASIDMAEGVEENQYYTWEFVPGSSAPVLWLAIAFQDTGASRTTGWITVEPFARFVRQAGSTTPSIFLTYNLAT